MTKLDLQKELLEKIKLGTKPSDIKKSKQKPSKTPLSPSPIEINKDDGYQSDPQITPTPSDGGYSSEEEKIPTAPPLPNSEQSEQIKALQKQLQLYKDFREADLKIKEKLKQENQALNKTIQDLKTQAKNTTKDKETNENPPEQTQPTTFACSSCIRTFNIELIRLVKKNGKKICRNCTLLMLKRANQLTGQRIVLKIKNDQTKPQPTFTCQTCLQTQPGEPHQAHITNFIEQGINPRQLTSICSTCLKEKVILADFYCPRTSEGRDTYNPKEPQFDCDCPQGGKHG